MSKSSRGVVLGKVPQMPHFEISQPARGQTARRDEFPVLRIFPLAPSSDRGNDNRAMRREHDATPYPPYCEVRRCKVPEFRWMGEDFLSLQQYSIKRLILILPCPGRPAVQPAEPFLLPAPPFTRAVISSLHGLRAQRKKHIREYHQPRLFALAFSQHRRAPSQLAPR